MFRAIFFNLLPALWLFFLAASFYCKFRRTTMIRSFAAEKHLETAPLNFFTSSTVIGSVVEKMPVAQQKQVRLLSSVSASCWGALLLVIFIQVWLRRTA